MGAVQTFEDSMCQFSRIRRKGVGALVAARAQVQN